MSKGHRNVRKIARRVQHDLELVQRRHDDRLKRDILRAVARTPLSDAQVAQVLAATLERKPQVELDPRWADPLTHTYVAWRDLSPEARCWHETRIARIRGSGSAPDRADTH